MAALIAAAKSEGRLNLIGVPRTLAGYGAIIDAFAAKYGITVDSADSDGSDAAQINAITSTKGASSAPDVVDVGVPFAQSAGWAGDFAPYEVSTWTDIPDADKDPDGLWYADYGGYISIGCDAAKLNAPCPTTISQLDNPAYAGDVALDGDPTTSSAAFEAVWAAALANGGSAGNIQPGIDFFQKLSAEGIFTKLAATPATITAGQTPIVLDWDYLNLDNAASLKAQGVTWTTSYPSDGLLSAYNAQAISINAPHPAAARLWEEYLYSASGQNGRLQGYARPVELPSLQQAGTADQTALALIPTVPDPDPFAPSPAQVTAADAQLDRNWPTAVG
jgi:putative spermidine/putrescine transport system substrate-binding protein